MFLQIPVFLGLFHVLQRLDPAADHDPDALRLDGCAVGQRRAGPAVRRPIAGPLRRRRRPSWRTSTRRASTVKIVAGVLVLIMMVTTFLTSRQMILKTGWSAGPAAAHDPEADALRHPVLAADLRLVLPDRRHHLLGHAEHLLARPAVLGAAQVPAAGHRRQHPDEDAQPSAPIPDRPASWPARARPSRRLPPEARPGGGPEPGRPEAVRFRRKADRAGRRRARDPVARRRSREPSRSAAKAAAQPSRHRPTAKSGASLEQVADAAQRRRRSPTTERRRDHDRRDAEGRAAPRPRRTARQVTTSARAGLQRRVGRAASKCGSAAHRARANPQEGRPPKR